MHKIGLIFVLLFNVAFGYSARNWQIGFQEAVTPSMEQLNHFHNILLIIIYSIVAVVSGLLAYVCIRFNQKNNPIPAKFAHNLTLEIVWTVIPILYLIVIAVPSFKLLYFLEEPKEAELTLKVVGHQWYWRYQYPDLDDMEFESYMITDDKLQPGQLRLLDVDNPVVLPINTNIKVLITSGDVIHNWAVPAFGIKTDAIPGKVNQAWLNIKKEGIYYGQCSELCGVGHGFMPIAVRAVSKEEYKKWTEEARVKFASADNKLLAKFN